MHACLSVPVLSAIKWTHYIQSATLYSWSTTILGTSIIEFSSHKSAPLALYNTITLVTRTKPPVLFFGGHINWHWLLPPSVRGRLIVTNFQSCLEMPQLFKFVFYFCWKILKQDKVNRENSSFIAHLSRPWSIGWVALSFLVRSFVRWSRYGNIWPNIHFFQYILA